MNLSIVADPLSVDTFFVGRQSELESLAAHFSRGGRLAQINGIFGTGKTALAIMFSHKAASAFPGGVKHVHAFPPQTIESLILSTSKPRTRNKRLVVVDDIDLVNRADFAAIPNILK